jgi:hypothetical protein
MNNSKIITDVINKTQEFVKKHNIHTIRDIDKYINSVTTLNYGLTLSFVSKDDIQEILFIKNLYAIWNIIVDDDIDVLRSTKELEASEYIINNTVNNQRIINNIKNESLSAEILNFILNKIKNNYFKEWFIFDISEILKALRYEYMTNKNLLTVNSFEYTRHAPLTASPIAYLDIDLASLGTFEDFSLYSKLRLACHYLSIGIKYASDIGTLKRELENESNLNIVIIKALEKKLIDSELLTKKNLNLDKIKLKLSSTINEIKEECLEYFLKGKSVLNTLPIETTGYINQIKNLIDLYLKEIDNFY